MFKVTDHCLPDFGHVKINLDGSVSFASQQARFSNIKL